MLVDDQAWATHSLFKHQLFKSSEFLKFKTQLLQANGSQVDPMKLQLQKALPQMSEVISSNFKCFFAEQEKLRQQVIGELHGIKSSFQLMASRKVAESFFSSGLNLLQASPQIGEETSCHPATESPNTPVLSPPEKNTSASPCQQWPVQSRKLTTVKEVWNEYVYGFPGEMKLKRTFR